MQRRELVIKPTLKAMLYCYRLVCMSRETKGSYQGNVIINLALSNFYIPAVFLLFYNIYYGVFIFLIGLFFVALQNLHVYFSPNKVKYIISQNEIKIIDGLNNKTATMSFKNKNELNIKILPSLKGDMHDLGYMSLKTKNDNFYLLGISKESMREVLDFLESKKIIPGFENEKLSKFGKAKNITISTMKIYLFIVLLVNVVFIFLAFSVPESTKIMLLQILLPVLITSEIIFYFILKLFCKNNRIVK